MIAHSKKNYTFSTTAETTSDLIPKYVICFMFTKETARRERRCKQLPDDQKTKKYWQLKEEALDRTPWRTFGRRDGSFIRLRDDDDDNFQIPFGVPFVYPKPKLSYGKALLDYQIFNTNLHYKLNCYYDRLTRPYPFLAKKM
jgi:hypothetical protein